MAPLVPRLRTQPADLTFRDFKTDIGLGRASLYGDLANAAASKICGLYGKSPSTLVTLIPFGSGAIDNSRGIFDDLCENQAPLPAPPTSPFSGGQCDRVRYSWTASVVLRNAAINGDFPPPRTESFSGSFWGPVQAIRLEDFQDRVSGPFNSVGYSRLVAVCRGDGGLSSSTIAPVVLVGSSGNEIQSYSGLSIVKFDGTADTCGNPPPSYPPPSATPGDLQGTTIINVAPNVPITVPVTIIPTFAPITGIFRPEFNVDVGGINVNISAGGFTFSPTLELPVGVSVPNPDPRTNPPPALPIGGSDSQPVSVDFSQVLDKIQKVQDEVDRCCDRDAPFSPPDPAKVLTQSFVAGRSFVGTLPSRTFKIEVVLTSLPQNKKMQAGLTAPDVLYAGWLWFSSSTRVGDRQPIDSALKVFSVPPYIATGFAMTLYQDYAATITAYYIKPT